MPSKIRKPFISVNELASQVYWEHPSFNTGPFAPSNGAKPMLVMQNINKIYRTELVQTL